MPLCKCPTCRALFDLQVDDVKAWYAEKWPEYGVSQLVPELCPRCKKEEHGRLLESEPPARIRS